MTTAPAGNPTLLDAVAEVRAQLDQVVFGFPPAAAEAANARKRLLIEQIEDNVLPRLRELSAPAIVVFGGSTGAGKSTLVNSLLGREVAATGVLRPTTRKPVLVVNPIDLELLASHPVLELVDVVRNDGTPRGIALLDAPDVDSVSEANRDLARRLLGVADLWLFVTTAARYGDAVPWDLLDQVARRQVPVAIVLNRVPDAALTEVRRDLLARLQEHEMKATPVFTIPEVGPHTGLLSATLVEDLLAWLDMLAGPDHARGAVLRALRGTLDAMLDELGELAAEAEAELVAVQDLRELAASSAGQIAHGAAALVTEPGSEDSGLDSAWATVSAPGGPLAGVLTRRGRVRGGRRGRRRRGEALTALYESALSAGAAKLLRSGDACEFAIARMLGEGPAGREGTLGPATPEQQRQRREIASKRIESWRDAIAGALRQQHGGDMERLYRAFGLDGVTALVLAAGTGNQGAAGLMAEVAPGRGPELAALAAAGLRDAAESMAQDRLGYVMRWMDDLAIPPGVVASLRHRIVRLRGQVLL